MIDATRREANEIYTLFSLLSAGNLSVGDAEGKVSGHVPVALVKRMEHDGPRTYTIEESDVHIVGTSMDERIPREDFGDAARWILARIRESEGEDEIDLSDLEGFLDALHIFDMEARTEDTTDLHIALWSKDAPLVGIRIQSRLCGFRPLLDGGRAANIKLDQTGVRFSGPAVHKINWCEDEDNIAEVARRILYIQDLGGILKYGDVADKIFRSNLLMLDTNLPRILGTMLLALHLDCITRVDQLVRLVEEKNPLKQKDELVQKHSLYEYKVRQLLLASAWGMRPAKQFNGRQSAVGGYIMIDASGKMLLYSRADEQTFSDYLFTHTRFEKALPSSAKYGYLERENGAYHLKLNLKIGWVR